MARRAKRTSTLGLLLVLAGCATPPPAGVAIPTLSPRREALSYFPADAPVVAVVKTDPQDPGLRRVAAAGRLAPLARAARARRLHFAQLHGLLGNDAVVGQPRVGAPPLGVLATDDAEALATYARARVLAHLAAPAGRYRGAALYAERGWAFAVRGRVLLAGASTRELSAALDQRVSEGSFEAAQLGAVLPDDAPPAAFARVYVDLRPLLARASAAARAVPLARALTTAGVTVGATATELQATAAADTSGAGLTDADLPDLRPPHGRRPAIAANEPALAVADLEPLALAAERAARAALPVGVLRLDALRARLDAAGLRLAPRVLEGPAVLVLSRSRPRLRLQPAHPRELTAALAHAARRLRGPALRLRREGDLYAVTRRGRVVARLGMVGGALVAGDTSAAALRRLAAAPLTELHSPVLLRLPRAGPWYPHPIAITLRGTPDRLRLAAFSGF